MSTEAITRLQSQIGMSATPKEMTYVLLAILCLIVVGIVRKVFS
jgi:hypothetical protein